MNKIKGKKITAVFEDEIDFAVPDVPCESPTLSGSGRYYTQSYTPSLWKRFWQRLVNWWRNR